MSLDPISFPPMILQPTLPISRAVKSGLADSLQMEAEFYLRPRPVEVADGIPTVKEQRRYSYDFKFSQVGKYKNPGGKIRENMIRPSDFIEVPDDSNISPDTIYYITEVSPEFPDGAQALTDYLKANVNYPAECREANTKGTVPIVYG